MDAPRGDARFPTTRWSLVARAGKDAPDAQRQALGELLTRYLPALRAHLLYGKRLTPEDADDLLQDFVAGKIIERELLGRADAQLGKFRTFLLTSLDRFLIDRFREENARKRSPGAGRLEAWGDQVEAGAANRPCDAFDLAWAREVIEHAVRLMRAECETSGRTDVWGVFECRLLGPLLGDAEPLEYEELVQRFNLQSPSQASNLLITGKRMFARAIRAVVGEYATEGEDLESEIQELMQILSRPRG